MVLGETWRVAAALIVLAGQALGQSNETPVGDFSSEEINAAMKDLDAVGEFTIPDPSGFDLSKKWPGEAVSGWKARIEIKAHVPVGDSKFTTLTRISYVPPESVEVTTNDTGRFTATDNSWYPCSNLWVSNTLKSSSADIGAACSVLPSKCDSDLQEIMTDGFFGSWDSQYRGAHCPITKIPSSCRSTIGNGTRLLGVEPRRTNPLTAFNLNQWYYYEEDDIHDKGNDTMYQAALERVWILGTAWGYSKNSEYANADDTPDTAGTVTCLRASEENKDTSQDEEKEENGNSGGENGGTTNGARVVWALSIASLIVASGQLL